MYASSCCLLLAVGLMLGGNLLQAADPPAADNPLLGTWQIEWVESNGEQNAPEGAATLPLKFKADHIETGDQKVSYTLDQETSPKIIDLEVKIGEEPKLRKLEGIYKIEQGKLFICVYLSNDGSMQRPASFTTKEGSNRIAVQLKRID